MSTVRMTAGNVLIEPEWGSHGPQSDIIAVPDAYKRRDLPAIGKVLSVGGKRKTKNGVLIDPEFKVGDRVVFPRFTGTLVEFEGKTLVQVKQHDIAAILEPA